MDTELSSSLAAENFDHETFLSLKESILNDDDPAEFIVVSAEFDLKTVCADNVDCPYNEQISHISFDSFDEFSCSGLKHKK